jgi:Holliday junction resolvasome RuvABC DNA-binding subunit
MNKIPGSPAYEALKEIGYTPRQAAAIVRGAARGEQESKDTIATALLQAFERNMVEGVRS